MQDSLPGDPDSAREERRSYARAHDAVVLHLQRLEEIPAAGEERPGVPSDPMGTVALHPNKYAIAGYAEVRRDHPEVAAYIGELEERIRQLLLDGDPATRGSVEMLPTHKVSLSLSGMAFADRRLLQPGELLGVTLTLFPSGRRIGSDVCVVSCNDAPEIGDGDMPTYRVVFVRMSDADREVLERHVRALLTARNTAHDE